MTAAETVRSRALTGSRADALLVVLAFAHGAILAVAPTMPAIALGLWWNSNTISHNFIHRPFFRRRAANFWFAVYLSALLGIPQSLWRHRHLAHHAGVKRRMRVSGTLVVETAIVAGLWIALAVLTRSFFFAVYLPGYAAGLGICTLHGYYEHARGTTSHYGRFYNLLFFNDGYHFEHHAKPGLHWSLLPESAASANRQSKWPAPLRWMEACSLEGLERLVLHSRALQQFVLSRHERALGRFRPLLLGVQNVGIVGGGLYPRTALILERLTPGVRITIIDSNIENLNRARTLLEGRDIEYRCEQYTGGPYDLIVFPLSFRGDKQAIYECPPAKIVVVHDWIWHKRGISAIVSPMLLKRVNLVRR